MERRGRADAAARGRTRRPRRRPRAIRAHLRPGDYVRIEVVDTGPGMAPEVRARAAEPFFSTKPRGQGAGLGLSMARGFADQSGGALRIDSEPGEGATVALWLPVAEAAITEEPAPDGAARGRLLLVDDDRLVRELVGEQLRCRRLPRHGLRGRPRGHRAPRIRPRRRSAADRFRDAGHERRDFGARGAQAPPGGCRWWC